MARAAHVHRMVAFILVSGIPLAVYYIWLRAKVIKEDSVYNIWLGAKVTKEDNNFVASAVRRKRNAVLVNHCSHDKYGASTFLC